MERFRTSAESRDTNLMNEELENLFPYGGMLWILRLTCLIECGWYALLLACLDLVRLVTFHFSWKEVGPKFHSSRWIFDQFCACLATACTRRARTKKRNPFHSMLLDPPAKHDR